MNINQFYQKVFPEPNTSCWLWGGRVSKSGHGIGRFALGIQGAHRFSFLLAHGEFDLSKHILHKCDVPSCVNPDHLYLGTQQDNNRDRDTRGRQKTKHGIDHKLHKLTNEQVIEIRRLYVPRLYPSRRLAREFGVSQRKILDIVTGKSWNHLL